MCEAATRATKSWWTIDGGYCLPYSLAYQTLKLDTTNITNTCAFFLKCALSGSLDQSCECKNAAACRKAINDSCEKSYLNYPESDSLIFPYFYMQYARKHDWTNKKPDMLLYDGRVKCIGYQMITNGGRRYALDDVFRFYSYRISETRLCNMQEGIVGNRSYSGLHYDINCWNNSNTFNNRSYQVSFRCKTRCVSKYRVRDGVRDCFPNEELSNVNNSCPEIQRHRLQCSLSEPTCLLAAVLGNWGSTCSNNRDEFDLESGTVFFNNLKCERRADVGCVYFRNYIGISSSNSTNQTTMPNSSILDDHSTIIPFRSYCNSFFDTTAGIDELPDFCEQWVCLSDQYQCLSGQCISQSWVCDGKLTVSTVSIVIFILLLFVVVGEWDCSDGSDEQRIFIMDYLTKHNSKLMNLTELKQQCYQQYRSDNTPFFDICNISFEYPCFRTGIDHPFNLTVNRPCIHLTQIGDGITDCLSGLDERNRLQCSGLGMLGFHFQFNDSRCVGYNKLCTVLYPWTQGADAAYDSICFYQKKRFQNDTVSNCNSLNDVMCLNNVCLTNARCNGKIECLYGEDEYRCVPQDKSFLSYRGAKKTVQSATLGLDKYPLPIQLLQNNQSSHRDSTYPSVSVLVDERNSHLDLTTELGSVDNATTVHARRNPEVNSVYEIIRDSLPSGTITFENHYTPFICNRGVAVKYFTGNTVCFCPPSFYGSQCEFYSDRITVATHLDLANYRPSLHQTAVIKVLTTFLFEGQIIDYYEFHVNPQIQTNDNYVKQGIYFLYPRLEEFLEMKKFNRSGTQLYSVRFEAFNLHLNETIEPIGVWQYPIYFDFLPGYRLSKILRFNPPVPSLPDGPCLNNSCGNNGVCQEVINSNRLSSFCFCNSAYHGIRCEYYNEECSHYCSPRSICKSNYSGILTGNQQPLCLCSASTFGNTCYLKNNNCRNNPCLHGGSCVVTYELTDTNNYTCLCTDLFAGDHCQFPKGIVDITFVLSPESTLQTIDVVATTVSYSNYDDTSLRFNIRHQQVYDGLPSHLKLIYSNKLGENAPATAILKIYGPNYHTEEPGYYVLYFHHGQKMINITVDLTSENYCPLVETLWHLDQTIETPGELA
jgi:hypothetical protein